MTRPSSPGRDRHEAATAVFVVAIVLFLAGLALLVAARYLPVALAAAFLTEMALPFVGLFIVRRAGNRVGWIFLASGLALSIQAFAFGYGAYGLAHDPGSLPAAVVVAWVGEIVWLPQLVLGTMFLFLLFPDGRLPSRRWRPVVYLGIAGAALIEATVVGAPTLYAYPQHRSPLGGFASESTLEAIASIGGILLLATTLLALSALVVRYRRAEPGGRQQIKWFVYAAAVYLAGEVTFNVMEVGRDSVALSLLSAAGALLVPTAVAVAIVRHRLYDIDVIINRTLVYATLTVILGATYLASVVGLQSVLAPLTDDSDLAVAASTLAVAAMFRPVRERVQRLIDKHFYRLRYDAGKTLELFAARLRDEVDLEHLRSDLLALVGTTMHPRHASLWLRPSSGGRL